MTREELFQQIVKKRSYLCVGLDTDLDKIPPHLRDVEEPLFEFNKQIIDQTNDLCVSYKLNLAFYERYGVAGMQQFQKTVDYIPNDQLIIADAKRGDIGNTATMYARAFFEQFNCDAITVAPYMGMDSVDPFLQFEGKWTIVLGLTSNPGAADFQLQTLNTDDGSSMLYESVIGTFGERANPNQLMFVVGATKTDYIDRVRAIAPDHFLLVPGVGAQGGSLEEVSDRALNDHCGILVNSSRGIIYQSKGSDFAQSARKAALELQNQMQNILISKGLVS